jgi:hypothetical protein
VSQNLDVLILGEVDSLLHLPRTVPTGSGTINVDTEASDIRYGLAPLIWNLLTSPQRAHRSHHRSAHFLIARSDWWGTAVGRPLQLGQRFIFYSLRVLKLGFAAEGEAYINFIFDCINKWQRRDCVRDANSQTLLHLPLMFSIDGDTDLPEQELQSFGGYLDSKPVRGGNAATGHIQLDIYGELMDAFYL